MEDKVGFTSKLNPLYTLFYSENSKKVRNSLTLSSMLNCKLVLESKSPYVACELAQTTSKKCYHDTAAVAVEECFNTYRGPTSGFFASGGFWRQGRYGLNL